ncbi:hypothetical protein [Polyangium sp. 15x6]|uniref:hypothetical protein n=1 Tax=Polyangium sp. 15x6 TaxID=3042687 RepID=UPI00249B336C|nr:hypothetical protein [Polyangium sp. 15x6]MDI3290468.1 hypothetical protein [Polyangium sp. 15x6]
MSTTDEPTTEAPELPNDDTAEPPELPTEYAIGSDGRFYVTEEGFKRGGTVGRKQFVGYQLTDEEAAEVWDAIHRLAFNATQPLRARR